MAMASNPPFYMEDQTDEDFFDKLVDDDDDELKPPGLLPQSHSSVTDAFSNLSIGGGKGELKVKERHDSVDFDDGFVDSSVTDEKIGLPSSSSFDFDSVVEPAEVNMNAGIGNSMAESGSEKLLNSDIGDAVSKAQPAVAAEGDALASSNSFDFDTLTASTDKVLESEGTVDLFNIKSPESAGGIKEVGWSSFHADAPQGATDGFGAYNDFFSDFGGGGSESFPGNAEQHSSSDTNVASGDAENGADRSGDATGYTGNQEYEASGDLIDNMQDMNSSQYWENLYPGWRYDPSTEQWYQVDPTDIHTGIQETSDNAAVSESVGGFEEKNEVSYLQQATQSVGGTLWRISME